MASSTLVKADDFNSDGEAFVQRHAAVPTASAVQWLSPDELGEWDAFVTRHPLGVIYHSSSWQKVLERAFKHIRGQFLVSRNSSGEIQAGLPVYNVSSWLLKNRTVSVPFATICDPLVSTKEQFASLWPAIEAAAGKHGSRRIEIRTRNIGADCIPHLLTPHSRYKHHYLPLADSTEALFRSFHDSCVCRRVKKAKKVGIVIEERSDEQSLREFHALMSATRQRIFLPPMPLSFFEAMLRCLSPGNASLYLAFHEGKPVGGVLTLKFKDMWTGEYSGHTDDAPAGTDQLLYWHAIQLAKTSGAKFFSFGRTSLDNEGLLEYKRRWATVEEDATDFAFSPGAPAVDDAVSSDSANPAFDVVKRLLRYTPSALQRSFGNFCYRHLG